MDYLKVHADKIAFIVAPTRWSLNKIILNCFRFSDVILIVKFVDIPDRSAFAAFGVSNRYA